MPVAVLVIDQKTSTVTYANTAAVELAGNVAPPGRRRHLGRRGRPHRPRRASRWPAAAARCRPSRRAGRSPARRSGSRPAAAPTAARAPTPTTGDADQLLWVTGFPLSQTDSDAAARPGRLPAAGPARATPSDPDAYLQALRERAVIATDITFTITDPRQPDNPLVWVNPSFTRITGYEADEVVGRNCRFLQGPATDPAAVAEIRAALAEQRTVTTTLLNYRKDGTAFWNQLSVSPVFDGEGELVSFVGVQTDVTERVRVEREREAAFAAEQAARREAELARSIAEQARRDAERAQADAERAQSRLALMAEATSTLIATLDMTELLDRLAGAVRPAAGRLGVRHPARRRTATCTQFAARHRDGRDDELRGVRRAARRAPRPGLAEPAEHGHVPAGPARRAHAGGARARSSPTRARWRRFQRLGGAQVLTVPHGRPPPHARAPSRWSAPTPAAASPRTTSTWPPTSPAGRRSRSTTCGSTSGSTRSPTRSSGRCCPSCPRCPGIEAAAHYVSASTAADVGGDFYDLLHLPDGSVGIAVGDVVGHDVAAAAAMGHLRGLLRAVRLGRRGRRPRRGARPGRPAGPGPAGRLAGDDGLRARRAAGRRRRALAGARRQRRAPAGAAARTRRRASRSSTEVTGLLVGVDVVHAPRVARSSTCPRGSTLVAYTDGLIERPGHDMDEGIHELCERITARPVGRRPRASSATPRSAAPSTTGTTSR